MSPVKDVAENKMVYLFPWWVRAIGVVAFVMAAGFSYAFVVIGMLDRNIVSSIFQ